MFNYIFTMLQTTLDLMHFSVFLYIIKFTPGVQSIDIHVICVTVLMGICFVRFGRLSNPCVINEIHVQSNYRYTLAFA